MRERPVVCCHCARTRSSARRKPVIVDRLQQVVERMRLERVDREAIERRDENDHRHAFLRHLRDARRDPTAPGIWMSRNIRSGASLGDRRDRFAAVRALARRSRCPGASCRRSSRPRRASGSSSTMMVRMVMSVAIAAFERQRDLEAQARDARSAPQASAGRRTARQALAGVAEPDAAAGAKFHADGQPRPIVLHDELQLTLRSRAPRCAGGRPPRAAPPRT